MGGRKSLSLQLGSRQVKKKPSSLRTRKKTGISWSGIWTIIRKTGIFGIILLFLFVPYYLWSSGYILHTFNQLNHLSHRAVASLGLGVEDVVVEGRFLTPQKEILQILNVDRGSSIFSCSLPDAKKALEALPWVRSASVQRRLPETLYVRLSERRPIALWQNKGKLYLVDDQGKVLDNISDYPRGGLLVLTGEGAPKKASTLIDALADFPDIAKKVTGAIYISNRRWDILIDHKLRLKLSEFDMKGSLESFSKLAQAHKLEDKEIVGIDLRFKDRVYFQLSPEALERKKKIPGKNP